MRRPAPSRESRKKQRGFSLIELLIVIAVILIIAAIAIPNFVRSRLRANESAAVQNLRMITTANTVYLTTYGVGYADGLANLGGDPVIPDATQAGLIDSILSAGVKTGYTYTYTVVTRNAASHVVSYTLTAEPTTFGSTGERHFFTNQTGIIHFSTTGSATASDPPI
jgi:prepilin-type N-terminal cleavage/methylation domain-containing protein